MLLMVSWGSLGLVLGAFGGLLGALLVLLRALGGSSGSHNFPKTFWGSPPGTVFYCVLLHVARVRLRNLLISSLSVFLLASSLTLIFQIVVFPLLEPLGVDFELPSGPSHSWNPILSYTCDGFMAARRLPRSVRRSAAPIGARGVLDPSSRFLQIPGTARERKAQCAFMLVCA